MLTLSPELNKIHSNLIDLLRRLINTLTNTLLNVAQNMDFFAPKLDLMSQYPKPCFIMVKYISNV